MRADSGFFSYDMIDTLDRHNASWSITVAQYSNVKDAIDAIDDDAWQPIDYPAGGEAQIAETTIAVAGRRGHRPRKARKLRLIARRTRLLGSQSELWPNWRYHCFVTNRTPRDGGCVSRSCSLRSRDARATASLSTSSCDHDSRPIRSASKDR